MTKIKFMQVSPLKPCLSMENLPHSENMPRILEKSERNFILWGWYPWPQQILNAFIKHYKTGLTGVLAIVYCLVAASHYLNQCWIFINQVIWHSTVGNFAGYFEVMNPSKSLKITHSNLHPFSFTGLTCQLVPSEIRSSTLTQSKTWNNGDTQTKISSWFSTSCISHT